MKTYHGASEAKSLIPPCVYAIGNFDGVHVGHLSLLLKAREMASLMGVAFGVYTFWPHPLLVLSPDSKLQLICTREQKMQLLQAHGVEHVIEEPFTKEFATLSAQSFAIDLIAKDLMARAIVTGENFRFGHQAMGTPAKMSEWLKPFEIECKVMPAVTVDGAVCSSSRIRQLVATGNVASAVVLLGRPYSIVGSVVKGAGRGKKLGIPTANLKSESSLIPAPGVYASLVRIGDQAKLLKAATNIGIRPTFDGDKKIHVETHIIDYAKQIYGEKLEIFFVEKIRDERKFDSVDALATQIRIDIERAATVLF